MCHWSPTHTLLVVKEASGKGNCKSLKNVPSVAVFQGSKWNLCDRCQQWNMSKLSQFVLMASQVLTLSYLSKLHTPQSTIYSFLLFQPSLYKLKFYTYILVMVTIACLKYKILKYLDSKAFNSIYQTYVVSESLEFLNFGEHFIIWNWKPEAGPNE